MLTFRVQYQSCSNLVLEHLYEEFLIENSGSVGKVKNRLQ